MEQKLKIEINLPEYKIQEAMENFVFPDEIRTKMMKINKNVKWVKKEI